ncbi:MAG: GMC family oxidoreductase [Pseudomonadota bacterium]
MKHTETYSLVAVGSGFATSFFLDRYLRHTGPDARVLVLERGPVMDREAQIAALPRRPLYDTNLIDLAGAVRKQWRFSVGFGGGSNCWWGCTPRFLPSDFQMQSLYGVADDWPITYEDLAPYYTQAEEVMAISGPANPPYPMDAPYPDEAHAFSAVDRRLADAYGDLYVAQATARSRSGTASRSSCCANALCSLCPVDAKFTISNGFDHVYADSRVTVLTDAMAVEIITEASTATGVRYRTGSTEHEVNGDIVALGANAIFNAHLLLRSGYDDPALGHYLHEQAAVEATVNLDGLKNFDGSTVITGQGYMFYDGPHRDRRSAALLEGWNRARPRLDNGRWSEVARFKLIFEDLPLYENRVEISPSDPDRPVAITERRSEQLETGLAEAEALYQELFSHLPAEDYRLHHTSDEAHILGTARMGLDPETSVVDPELIHHRVRNLFVLGGSSFVTGSPSNPTLTLAALSLRSADRVFGGVEG